MQEPIKHSFSVNQRKQITVEGVESVLAFSDMKITLAVCGNTRMYVVGNDLKIVGFSKTTGAFQADGEIQGVSYGGKSFAAKLFK